jgi:hypothetical protein
MTNLLIDNYTDEDVASYLLNLDSSHDHAEFVTQKNMPAVSLRSPLQQIHTDLTILLSQGRSGVSMQAPELT